MIINHPPRAYDSARALRLCGPSAHYYHAENRALQPDEKPHTPDHVPPSGLLASLHLLVRGLLLATTRRTGEEEERKEEEEGRKKRGRREEELGRGKGREGRQADGLNSNV